MLVIAAASPEPRIGKMKPCWIGRVPDEVLSEGHIGEFPGR